MHKITTDMIEYVREMAKQSVCKRRGVACLIFDLESGDTLGWSVNGPALFKPELCSGIKDGCGCAHSEINTLLVCRPTKRQLLNHLGHMIATRAPCVPCATAIVNSGFISRLTYLDESDPGEAGLAILEKCGVHVERYDDGTNANALKDTASTDETLLGECSRCGRRGAIGARCPVDDGMFLHIL